jgi:hypothetical protein
MWGNVLGWKISTVMLLLAGGIGWWLHAQMQITDPTSLSLNPANLAPLAPPIGGQDIVDQNQGGDAGDDYRAAIATYEDAADDCEQFAQSPHGPPPVPMRHVLDAAHRSTMHLFDKDPASIVDYESDHPPLDNLAKIGSEMESAALLLERQKQTEDARTYLAAAYALGRNLYNERVDYDEYVRGMGLMDGATTALSDLEGPGAPRGRALADRQSDLVKYDQYHVLPIYQVLSSADQQTIAENAGDVFRFAAKARERMFRVEAILKLGRYRFDAARQADQLSAPHVLRRLEDDPDPVIHTAAQAAMGLSIEQYRMIH